MITTCPKCGQLFDTTQEYAYDPGRLCVPCYHRANGGAYMLHADPRAPCFCPMCQRWLSGRERQEHMVRHMEPATVRRIEAETGVAFDDFSVFCLQQSFDLDGLSADDPQVDLALRYWHAGGDMCEDWHEGDDDDDDSGL